ncbi:sugar kinase [Paracoccus sp. APAP_BH8]|uniref:sugar kinase n=1 Tax=Paracoccus sp. APAP_BH8 TaxID=3110237 RepID=UPI002FD7DA42
MDRTMKSPRVLSIGECMVEMAPAAGEGHYRMSFAGDSFNTAWYLRRLLPSGWAVDYFTAIGTDALSRRMAEFMAAAGIGCAHLQRLPGEGVGLYMIQLERGERSFSYWRSTSAARRMLTEESRLRDALRDTSLAYFSGITLGILLPEDRVRLLELLREARAAGTLVAFDPNLRPTIWPDADEMREAIMAAAAIADIVLPSFEDEAAHFGDASPEATAARYRDAGTGMVVVKNGAGDILTVSDDGLARHPAKHVSEIVDTTAAGDSFNAGFLARYLQGAPIAECVRAGAMVAARVIGAKGALVGVAL